jgi:DNA-binding IclR family transcriptional regulator
VSSGIDATDAAEEDGAKMSRQSARSPNKTPARGRKPSLTGLNQGIARPTAILESIAAGAAAGLRMTDVMKATGLGKATVHRLLAGLTECGLAEQDRETGRFLLGVRILSWAAIAADRFGLARLTEPAMLRLAQVTLDTVYLTARSADEAVCLSRREGQHPIKTLTLNAGDKRPLGVSAGGLALLAFLPDREVERILATQAEKRIQMPFDQVALRKMIAATRQAGFAYYDAPVLHGSEVVTGMAALAVPIRRADGDPIATLSVAAISQRLQTPRRAAIVAQLRDEARQIEELLQPVLSRGNLGLVTAG